MTAHDSTETHVDLGDLDPHNRGAVNYAFRVREHLSNAESTTFDALAKDMITPDGARWVSSILEVLDGWITRDIAALAGVHVPEGCRVADTIDVTDEPERRP